MQQDLYTSLKTEALHAILASATHAKIFHGCATQRLKLLQHFIPNSYSISYPLKINTFIQTKTANINYILYSKFSLLSPLLPGFLSPNNKTLTEEKKILEY